jgi:hypothetical protein
MKNYSPAALEAVANGEATIAGAVSIAAASWGETLRLWTGFGPLTLGAEHFEGVGRLGMIRLGSRRIGTTEQQATLSLSGIPGDELATLDLESLRGAVVVIHELIFDSSGRTLLAHNVAFRGRVDRAHQVEDTGGASEARITVDGAVRGLRRSRVRMRSDADQRLYLATDGAMSRVSFAGQKEIWLGGKPPVPAGRAGGGGVLPPSVGPAPGDLLDRVIINPV